MVVNQKTEVFKEPKDRHFRKGIIHSVCPKIQLFLRSVFCRNFVRKDRYFDILDTRECFLDQKIEIIKRVTKPSFS